MIRGIVVAGTDTGTGKTVFAAGLTSFLNATYWKPIQAGLDGETDSETVRRLGGLPSDRVLPEAYRLHTPASPHRAAQIDGIEIEPARLALPRLSRPLVIEGTGGLMVPLSRELTFIDVFASWRLPVVLCARTSLGTINHTLLSLEALSRRAILVLGIAFIGNPEPETERIIAAIGAAPVLGRLPWLESLECEVLSRSFRQGFGDRLLPDCALTVQRA